MGNTVRERLMQSVIKLAAEDGIENVTTKRAALLSGCSEITLFRTFETKDKLMFQSFDYVESAFYRELLSALPILDEESIEYSIRCRLFFMHCWKYLMAHPDQSRFYLRFQHSSYYEKCKKYTVAEGRQDLIGRIQPRLTKLPNNEGSRILLMQMLDTALNFVTRVSGGEISDSNETTESVFHLLFDLVETRKKYNAPNASPEQNIRPE